MTIEQRNKLISRLESLGTTIIILIYLLLLCGIFYVGLQQGWDLHQMGRLP